MKTKLIFITILILSLINQSLFAQAVAGSDQEICTDATIMAADPPPVGYTGTWTVISGACDIDNETLFNTSVTNLLNGFNELKWTITDGVTTDSDEVIITNNYPTQALTASDEEICENYHTLNANIYGSGESGQWTLENGSGILITPSNNVCDVTGLATNDNKFRWTIYKGICSSYNEILITNHKVIANAGTDGTTCFDNSNLNANNPLPGSGTWSVVASEGSPVFGNVNDASTTVTGLGANTNSLQWTVIYGICSEYDNIIITSNKPTTANAGSDKTICESYTDMSANNPTQGTGEWSVVSGNATFTNLNEYNTHATTINSGINKYKWTITKNGCTSEDEVEIFYDFYTADAGSNDVTCTESYTLAGNPPSPGTGKWRVTGGNGTFTDETLFNTEVTNLLVGENTFEWKITRGLCSQTDYVTITRNTASTADAGNNIETCNNTTTLSATNPEVGTGIWSVISGTGTFANASQNNTSVSNVGLNDNKYRWTVNYIGCSNYDEVIVTNNYVTTNAGSDQIVCGTTSTLDADPQQPDESGEWLLLAGSSIITDENLFNTSVTNLSSGLNKYRWTVSKGTCSDFDEIEIINNLYNASANVSGPSDICNDFTPIIGNSPPTGGTAFWTLESGNGIFDNSLDQSTVVRNLALGENIIRWTIEKNACFNYDEITINRNTVFADAGTDQEICVNYASLSAVPVTVGNTGIWTVGGGTATIVDPTNSNSDVTGLNIGLNTFIWTVNGNECSDDDNVDITNNMFFTSAGPNQEICINNTSLSGTNPNPGIGIWSIVTGTGVFSDNTNYETNVNGILNNSNNTYRWTVSNNGCIAFDDVTVTNNLIQADAGSDIILCNNFTNLVAANPSSGVGTWTVQSGTGDFANENSPTTEVTNISLHDNIYRWTVTNLTCSTFDDITVTNNFISAQAGADQEICYDFSQLYGDEPPAGGTGLWELISGSADIANTTLFNTNVSNLQAGYSTFKWTIFNNGCESTGDEITIHNKSFNAYAGEDQNLLPFTTSTNLEAELPINATGEWLLVGGGGTIENISDPSTTVSNMPTGTNQFLWSVVKDGCMSDDVVSIIVVNFTVNPGVNRIVCSDSVRLNAAHYTDAIETWSVVEGTGNFDNPNQYNTWVRNISLGNNIYRWTVTQDGATAYNDVTVIQTFAYAGEDQLVCEDDIVLNGNIPNLGNTGLWSVVAGSGNIITPTLYNTEIHNIGFGLNTFQWTINSPGECFIVDYVAITNDQVIANAGEDQEIESSDTYLDAEIPSNSDNMSWSVLSGSGNFSNETNPNTYVSDLTIGDNIFRWTVSNDNCSDYDDVTVTYTDSGIYIDDIEYNILIYPNPNNGIFTIEITEENFYNIEISDLYGKIIMKKTKIEDKNKQFDISNYPSGVYFLNINNGKLKRTIKILKNSF